MAIPISNITCFLRSTTKDFEMNFLVCVDPEEVLNIRVALNATLCRWEIGSGRPILTLGPLYSEDKSTVMRNAWEAIVPSR
jgi:hypothetical protein